MTDPTRYQFHDEDMSGARFEHVRLAGAGFDRVDLTGARLRMAELDEARIRSCSLHGARLLGIEARNLELTGEFEGGLLVNGVDVIPLVEKALNERYPERILMRPTDAAGYRHAWATLERLWAQTLQHARAVAADDPDLLHASVDGEWSFIQTLRHLACATESWVRRVIQGEPAPWAPLSLPWDEAPATPGVPHDRDVRPSLEQVLALRADRVAGVRAYLAGLTDAALAGETTPVDAPGWPRPDAYPVALCLSIVLNEEWEHRLYAERDLAVLAARARDSTG